MSTPADPGLPDRAGDGRTVVVTGSVAGIGAATRAYLEACGTRVIGVDLRDAEIEADLATATGREAMVSAVRTLAPRGIDGIVANAGVNREDALTIRVNYFGAVATLGGKLLLEHVGELRVVGEAAHGLGERTEDGDVRAVPLERGVIEIARGERVGLRDERTEPERE